MIRKFTSFDMGISSTLLAADGWYGNGLNQMYAVPGRFGRGYALNPSWDLSVGVRDRYWALDDFVGPTVFLTMGLCVESGYLNQEAFYLWDSRAGASAVTVRFSNLGAILVYNAAGTLVGQTPIGVWAGGKWFQFEMKVYLHDTAGTIEIRYNTKTVLNIINTDTRPGTASPAGVDAVRFDRFQTLDTPRILYNEIIVHDDNGTVNNDFLGNVNVNGQYVIGNGYSQDFTIGGTSPAATNWQSVLNTSLDDTKYVYSPNIGDLDFYDINPSLNSPVVYATQVKAAMRQDDNTQRIGRVGLRYSGTDYLGAKDFYLDQSYRFYYELWELNPSTGIAWTGAEVNSLEVSVKIEA